MGEGGWGEREGGKSERERNGRGEEGEVGRAGGCEVGEVKREKDKWKKKL